MSYLCNDASRFVEEATAGFVAANARWVRLVSGGVIRRCKPRPGQAVVVIGGGSGHYPAFGGIVGPGLAHGAAIGNVFASPSAHQIYNVAKAVDAGGGILFSYGNYAGDVLNFDQAQARLRAEGIDVRTVRVTDDIASAAAANPGKRRGIAGDLPVFKAACAAADEGASLDDVVRIASDANARVRTLGVAFSGCTLPGATAPLFAVNSGVMEVGMGIHGEPGLCQMPIPTADGLAEFLVGRLLAEIPVGIDPSTARVVVMLNGLGAVKYEELFVVYRKVDELLRARGVTIVEPEVGELVTSFNMAGVSLTLFWLTPELEKTWLAPADTPAFRKGSIAGGDTDDNARPVVATMPAFSVGSDQSRACAQNILAMLRGARIAIEAKVAELGRLDAVAGDGDHGIGMQRGISAATEAAETACMAGAGAGTLLKVAGDAWADRAGGTSGALWGIILRTLGAGLNDLDKPTAATVAAGLQNALLAVMETGQARVGDKTLIDAFDPFVSTLGERIRHGDTLGSAWKAAASAAETGALATAKLQARVGRARPHAEKSLGTPDPGAVSLALIACSAAALLEDSR